MEKFYKSYAIGNDNEIGYILLIPVMIAFHFMLVLMSWWDVFVASYVLSFIGCILLYGYIKKKTLKEMNTDIRSHNVTYRGDMGHIRKLIRFNLIPALNTAILMYILVAYTIYRIGVIKDSLTFTDKQEGIVDKLFNIK